MTVTFHPEEPRVVVDKPARVVVEMAVEQAARVHALLGPLAGGLDLSLFNALGDAIPPKDRVILQRNIRAVIPGIRQEFFTSAY